MSYFGFASRKCVKVLIDKGAEYCDERVCLSAIISSQLHVSCSSIAVAQSCSGSVVTS